VNTHMCFETPARLVIGVDAVSGTARVAGEKSARDRHASKWGVARVQLIQAPVAHVTTAVPTQNVAPSAQERST